MSFFGAPEAEDAEKEQENVAVAGVHKQPDGVHFFVSERCGWCRKMKSDQPGITESTAEYVATEHDCEIEMYRRLWGHWVMGFPTIVFKWLGEVEKYDGPRKKENVAEGFKAFKKSASA